MNKDHYTEIDKTQRWWCQRRFRITFISSAVVIAFIIFFSILLKFAIHAPNHPQTTTNTTTATASTVTTTSPTSTVTGTTSPTSTVTGTTSPASPTTTAERRSKL